MREEYTYDAAGRIIEHRSSTGSPTRITYDVAGRITRISDGKYGQRRFSYDAAGQLICVTNGLGGKTRYTYTLTGQVASITDAAGSVTTFEYDDADRLISSRDALGRTTSFAYDAAGRRTSMVDAAGTTHGFAYDAAGDLSERVIGGTLVQRMVRDSSARTVTFTDYSVPQGSDNPTVTGTATLTYNRLGALVRQSTTDGSDLLWSYNKDRQRTEFSFGEVQDRYEYTAAGLLASVTRTSRQTVEGADEGVLEKISYTYDSAGSLTTITGTEGETLYSSKSAPTAVVDEHNPQELVVDGGWAHTVTRVQPGTGETTETTTYYNEAGEVIGIDDTVDGLRLYSYDDAHLLASITTSEGVHRFEYSDAGFLTREVFPGGLVREYSYDDAGQLVTRSDSDGAWVEFVYDGLGRRVREQGSDGVVREYAWDVLDRLTGYTLSEGENSEHSTHVDLFRNPLGQLTAIGAIPVVFDTAETDLPSVISLGSTPVPLTTRAAGMDLAGARGVDAFGLSAPVFIPSFEPSPSDSSTQDAVKDLADKLVDADSITGAEAQVSSAWDVSLSASTGVLLGGLELLGARVYDPGTRGFLTPDPVASPIGAGWSSNVYAFAGFDPVSLVDPWGLSPVSRADFAVYAKEHPSSTLKGWANEHSGAIKTALIVGGVALTIAGALVAGPAAIIVLGALGGAALAGGFSIQKNENGEVAWGKVGKSALIGGVSGAIGGGVSQVLKVGGSAVASSFGSAGMRASNLLGGSSAGHALRYASSVVGTAFSKGGTAASSKFVPAVSAVGREAISGAATGAFSNTANYLGADIDHTVMGTASSLTQGALWGGGTAGLGARVKVSQWVPGFAPVEELAEKSILRNSVTNVVTDSLSGGVNSAGTYLGAPHERYGDKNLSTVKDMFTRGAFQGGLKSVSESSAPLIKEGSLKGVDFVISPLHNIQNISRFIH